VNDAEAACSRSLARSLGRVDIQRAGGDLLSVDDHLEGEVPAGIVEVGGMAAIAIIGGVQIGVRAHRDVVLITGAEILVVAVLVAQLHREAKRRELRVNVTGSLEAVQPPIAEKRDVGHHGKFVRALVDINGVEQLGNLIVLLSHVLRMLDILECIASPSILRVNAWLQRIGEGRQDTSVSPIEIEVVGLLSIWRDHFSHPFEELGLAFESGTLDLEAKNERPDKAEDELQVMIGDIFWSDTDELDALGFDEFDRARGVLEELRADLGVLVVFGTDILSRDDFQQVNQKQPIFKISFEIPDLHFALHQEVVAPTSKGLLLDVDPSAITRLLFFMCHFCRLKGRLLV